MSRGWSLLDNCKGKEERKEKTVENVQGSKTYNSLFSVTVCNHFGMLSNIVSFLLYFSQEKTIPNYQILMNAIEIVIKLMKKVKVVSKKTIIKEFCIGHRNFYFYFL